MARAVEVFEMSMSIKNKFIFLSGSQPSSLSNFSIALIVFEALGFIIIGFVVLYLSSFQSDLVFYILVGAAIVSLAIGFHILFGLVIYLSRSRHR
ncbi:hypothetical protein QPL79_06280 [Ignisphaera sp. 4213-co]|uniref:Uncharacterized protein n=1 Tax=Ignisphaera cupida TaxID=3050454 RepID=A0ABD4Z6L1_9CREN|nr:hypothetical protein [Ignisphaera sp. 4213-co]MDK6028966.1 hypothetical protein [Ignisphaera sp. 4213-co]